MASEEFCRIPIVPVYCPTRSCRWHSVLSDGLGPTELPDWPQLTSALTIPLYYGRVGAWILCELWHVQPGDEILMPAYNCGSEVDPFHAYGAKVLFYRVNENAAIDYEDLKRRCSSKTRIVYITHYFGWPHPVVSIYNWCRENGIRVVEDCALSLFSTGGEGHLGTLADASLFSFRKALPVPDGAALVLRDRPQTFSLEAFRKPPLGVTMRNLRPFMKSSLLDVLSWMGVYSYLRKKRMDSFDVSLAARSVPGEWPEMPPDYYFDRRMRNWKISPQAAGILRRTNPTQVIDRRRRNYLCLLERVRAGVPKAKPLFDTLPEGVCPLGLILLVPRRYAVVKALNACGIAAFAWWEGYHRDFDWRDFQEAARLKDSALFLPVAQAMNERHMIYIGDCLERVCSLLDAG